MWNYKVEDAYVRRKFLQETRGHGLWSGGPCGEARGVEGLQKLSCLATSVGFPVESEGQKRKGNHGRWVWKEVRVCSHGFRHLLSLCLAHLGQVSLLWALRSRSKQAGRGLCPSRAQRIIQINSLEGRGRTGIAVGTCLCNLENFLWNSSVPLRMISDWSGQMGK